MRKTDESEAKNMETITLESWEEFESELAELENSYWKAREENSPCWVSDHIFRGQPDSCYGLETTLERYLEGRGYSDKRFDVEEYYRISVARAQPAIESLTGKSWQTCNWEELSRFFRQDFLFMLGSKEPPALGYLAYLRHHGFPSPLLDWTRSPYVAAFFAFQKVNPKKVESVSIFAYQENVGRGRSASGGDAVIETTSHLIQTHERHFRQQAVYTICTTKDRKNQKNSHFFVPHAEAFKSEAFRSVEFPPQSRMVKYEIPSGEKPKVLARLDQYNLNAFTLFGTEDSLMDSMAFREFSELERCRSRLLIPMEQQLEAAE